MGEELYGGRVTWTVTAGVADVRLNRPDKLNALDAEMFDALVATADALGRDPSVRAVVISGEGRAFCAGLDFAAFLGMAAGGTELAAADGTDPGGGDSVVRSLGRRTAGRITNHAQQAAYAWHAIAVPTIAAIHGVALGGGLQIALGADLRFVAPDARLSVLEVRWGLIPDMTGTYFLPRLVGVDVAKELTWSGRMVGGSEAVRLGLATQVHDDPRQAGLAFAAEIAGRSPEAIRGAKGLLDRSLDSVAADQFVTESRIMGSLIGAPNQLEAVNAFFEKRPPTFVDPA
jgi:enoyl-CoA hydratase/carnithine racemase